MATEAARFQPAENLFTAADLQTCMGFVAGTCKKPGLVGSPLPSALQLSQSTRSHVVALPGRGVLVQALDGADEHHCRGPRPGDDASNFDVDIDLVLSIHTRVDTDTYYLRTYINTYIYQHMHCVTLHYITLHYITLHYIKLH